MKKIYLVVFQYSMEDKDGVETQAYNSYKKAVNRFNEIIENEKRYDTSFTIDAFEEDGTLFHNYELDRSDFTDGKEHELWWYLTCKIDWQHIYLELRILEVK